MDISVVRTLPEDQWRSFVEEHPAGNIFHTPEMFRVFNRTKNYRAELFAVVKRERVLALFLPVKITLMNGILRFFTTRSVSYGGVLCEEGPEGREALAKLLQTYKHQADRKLVFTELRNLSNMEPVEHIIAQHGFIYEDYLNYLIDLKRLPENIFQSFGRRTRKNLRRTLRQNVLAVEEVKNRNQLPACYHLLRRSYHSARIPLADGSLFEAAFDALYNKGMVRFSLVYLDQIPVAVSVDLIYKDVIYGWYGGVDRNYSSYGSNELVHWHILRWGAENGHRIYDFGGAGKPDEKYGVRDFKAKFGGELVCFGRFMYWNSPWRLKVSRIGYQLFRKIL